MAPDLVRMNFIRPQSTNPAIREMPVEDREEHNASAAFWGPSGCCFFRFREAVASRVRWRVPPRERDQSSRVPGGGLRMPDTVKHSITERWHLSIIQQVPRADNADTF